MKKLFLTVLICAIAFGAFAQQLNIDPSKIDFSKVDLSKVKFYFQGPMEMLVKGVVYNGTSYAVTLDYDGMGTMTAKMPASTSSAGLPKGLDLSGITLKLGSDSLMVENVVADGATFSGKLVPTTLSLQADNLVQARVAEPKLVAMPSAAAVVTKTVVDTAKVSALEKEIKALKAELEKKDATIAELKDMPPQVVVKGEDEIKGTRVVVGDNIGKYTIAKGAWKVVGSKLVQSDDDQLYAKFILPVSQSAMSQEYAFKVASTGSGRVGAGLHFLASDVKQADKYGFGSSYLVWLTKDPTLQTSATFVQVYKSSTDTRMVQVASQAISSDISKMNAVKVIADRSNDMLYVFVNGMLEISMPAEDLYGNSVALRTMGSAEFSF